MRIQYADQAASAEPPEDTQTPSPIPTAESEANEQCIATLAITDADEISNIKNAQRAARANKTAQITKVFPSHNMMRVIAILVA